MKRKFASMQNYKSMFFNTIRALAKGLHAFAVPNRFLGRNYALGFNFQVFSKDFIY